MKLKWKLKQEKKRTPTIKVLDQRYSVEFIKEPDDYMQSNDCNGYCDFIDKSIVVLEDSFRTTTLRHEVFHAFLFESGIPPGVMFHTEGCVQWVAQQLPKIEDAIRVFDQEEEAEE